MGMAKMKRKPAGICCGVVLAVMVVLAVVFVALYFTVFRPRSPSIVATVVSSRISTFDPPLALNLSFDVDVTAHNPNYASFRYGEVVTGLTYHGEAVGQSVVPAGEIGARTTETVGATVELDAVKVLNNPYFLLVELPVGVLHFETRTAVPGKAVVMGKFRISASSVVNCNVTVYPWRKESTSQCTSRVHVG